MFYNDRTDLINYIRLNHHRKIRLFFDIETLQYNEKEGYVKPSKFKNVTYSVAVSYFNNDDELAIAKFPNFKHFFEAVFTGLTNKSGKVYRNKHIELIAHNNNKYDNHYLIKDITYYYPLIERHNMFVKNAKDNSFTLKEKELTIDQKLLGVTLEKRIKSSINLDMVLYLEGVKFTFIDNYMKTNLSLGTLGKKLLRLNLLTEEELKTEFDYQEFNRDEDMTEKEARSYAEYVFENKLTDKHFTYIDNDVIILAYAVRHYTEIFPGFDYDKITFTSNILEKYNTNDLTGFQLLNDIPKTDDSKKQQKIKYTDYNFANQNLYDYLKSFFNGGLNFFNDKLVGLKLNNGYFGIDINSSYPYSYYAYKIPTYLMEYGYFNNETKEIPVTTNTDYYYLYRMDKTDFNHSILYNIESDNLKKILVKYYSNNTDYVNINTYTLKIIEDIGGVKLNTLKVHSWLKYECVEFGNKEEIENNYYIKTQGSNKHKIIMDSPVDIIVTDMENSELFTRAEIDHAKVYLNGLYGIPSLRPYFNLFKLLPNNELENIENGFKNSERNILFSAFVTSVSLYNLLEPLKYLTQEQIDEWLIYTDTDSLYLDKRAKPLLPDTLFNDNNLGKWSYDCEDITQMYVLNHKKYAYYDNVKKEIVLKCGGINLDSFNLYKDKEGKRYKESEALRTDKELIPLSFDEFISEEFHHGKQVKNTKSILTEVGTVAIYESNTLIEAGGVYPVLFTKSLQKARENLLNKIKDDLKKTDLDDVMYIESELGTFSQKDIYYEENGLENTKDIDMLRRFHYVMKKNVLS